MEAYVEDMGASAGADPGFDHRGGEEGNDPHKSGTKFVQVLDIASIPIFFNKEATFLPFRM
jgi:hypothetical protein